MLCFECILASPLVKSAELVGIVLPAASRTALGWPMHRASRKRRARLRVEGPLAPYFEPYSEYLAGRGYSQVAFWHKTFLINEFSRWLKKEGIAACEITAKHEQAFLHYNALQRLPKLGDPTTLRGLTCWLQDQGVIESRPAASADESGAEKIVREYVAWLREERGLAPTTTENYAGVVRRFLEDGHVADAQQLASIRGPEIVDYIQRNAPRDRTFAAAKNIVTTLRSFFRFARYRIYTETDLAACVPSVAGWSMATIPRAMPTESVKRLLNESKTWRGSTGQRNRAILLLLARLGLRAREVVRLELEDIDWQQSWLRVQGKGRQERPLPLPHDVGEAIASYLKDGRPESECRNVFLHSRAPYGALRSNGAVCQVIRRAIGRAKIDVKVTGSHQLRHALAVDMLGQGLSLTEIGQMLRHRSPEATRRYAKVDLEGLRAVALPWPGDLP
jgi:site-specific recombinase XerD